MGLERSRHLGRGVFSPTGLSGEAGGQSTRGRRVPGEI